MNGQTDQDKISDEKKGNTLAMWCHLSTFTGALLPFTNFLMPLIIWVAYKDSYDIVDDQGKESINFQITLFIYGIIATLFIFIVVGVFLLAVVALFAIIQVIKASIDASNGKKYRYPLCLRFIK